MIRNATIPEGVPALHYPLDLYGYLLVPGRKYHKLAYADHARDGEPAGQSILAFVEFTEVGWVLYRAKGWKQRGEPMAQTDAELWAPYVAAAKAWLDGTGPATWVAERTVDVSEGYVGRRVETAPVEGWTSERVEVPGEGYRPHLTVWTHAATGAVVEDRTYAVPDAPARGTDAQVAYAGRRGADATRWAEFETFARAAAYALDEVPAA